MNLSLKKLVELITEEAINEALRDFSINFFKSLRLSYEKVNYASEHLPLLGSATSRNVYAINSGKVLKIALNERGIAQNQAEVEIFTSNKDNHLVTRIYDFDSKYGWTISELVKEFRTEEEFKAATALDEREFMMFVTQTEKSIEEKIVKLKMEFEELVKNEPDNYNIPYKKNTITLFEEDLKRYSELMNDPRIRTFITDIKKMINTHQLNEGDIIFSHFGQNKMGAIKLFDYGATKEVIKKHYSRIHR